MKRLMKQALIFFIACIMCTGGFADIPLAGRCSPVLAHASDGTDYSRYSNVKKSWFIKRNANHQPAEGAVSAKDLAGYQAYYYDQKTNGKVIYLTFDCGYENGYTGKLLDILKKHNVKAIFFVTRHFVRSQPELCKRMKEEGHLVGNHTMNHPSLPDQSVTQMKNEIQGLETFFKEKTGYQLDKYFRPPMGEFSNRVLKVAQDLGYTTVFWSMVYKDYDIDDQPGKQYVIDHFNKYYHKGAIALLHNISQSNADALDEVLTNLKKQGYQCMRIDALGQETNIHVAAPQWDEYLFCDGKISPTCIELRFFADVGKDTAPEGFEIYRKEKGGSYQLTATVNANKNSSYTYKDRNVKTGQTYYYKVKSYRYLYGKKYVATVDSSMKKTAVNQKGKYTVTYVKTEDADELVIKVKSDKNNGISLFSPDIYWEEPVWTDGDNEVAFNLYAYSTDRVTWHDLTKKEGLTAKLKPGSTIYLKLSAYGEPVFPNISECDTYVLKNLSVKYNGFYYTADMNLKTKKGTAKIIAENYH